ILTGSIYSALIGGFVTAIWFQPPYGTLSVEQTAFLFACLALQCLQEASRLSNHYSMPYWFLSGCCVCCACLSKQNAGAFFLPICFGVLLIQGFQLTRR